jgi:MerR family redox-sensitive transcriptional activator SoxR
MSDHVEPLNSAGSSRAVHVDAPAGRWREKESGVRDDATQLTIGEVARLAGMRTSRIRYYEAQDLLPVPDRVSGKRRYSAGVLRQLAIIDAAQGVGFTLDEIRELLGSRDRPAHERARRLAQRKLPEVEELIERATSVRRLLEACSACDCGSLDVCELFDDHQLRLTDHSAGAVASRLVALRDDARGDSPPTAYP